jgi:hypothetical protein
VASPGTTEAGDPSESADDDVAAALERDFMELFSAGVERPCNQTFT